MSHLHDNRKILNRIKRVQGQMNAVHSAMSNEDVSCLDVLQQVAAIRGAINGLMNELVEQHLKTTYYRKINTMNRNSKNFWKY